MAERRGDKGRALGRQHVGLVGRQDAAPAGERRGAALEAVGIEERIATAADHHHRAVEMSGDIGLPRQFARLEQIAVQRSQRGRRSAFLRQPATTDPPVSAMPTR